jgi:hypothetical protein
MKYFYHRYWGYFSTTDPRILPPYVMGVGYSGNLSSLNNPSCQEAINQGPLPAGLYTITYTDSQKGPLTHHLTPDLGNKMYYRGGFLNHGDDPFEDHTASDGCIVSPEWTRAIFRVGDQFEVL